MRAKIFYLEHDIHHIVDENYITAESLKYHD